MPGGQFSHFRDKMSLAWDIGHSGSIPGRSQPFRDGWQAYLVLALGFNVTILTYYVIVLDSSSP